MPRALFVAIAFALLCSPAVADKTKKVTVSRDTFHVVIDYSVMAIPQSLRVWGFDYSQTEIAGQELVLHGSGKVKAELTLVRFSDSVSTSEAHARLAGMKLKPAKLEYLLALAWQYPDTGWRFPVVAVSTDLRDLHNKCYSGVIRSDVAPSGDSFKRGLQLSWYDLSIEWPDGDWLFLAIVDEQQLE